MVGAGGGGGRTKGQEDYEGGKWEAGCPTSREPGVQGFRFS